MQPSYMHDQHVTNEKRGKDMETSTTTNININNIFDRFEY